MTNKIRVALSMETSKHYMAQTVASLVSATLGQCPRSYPIKILLLLLQLSSKGDGKACCEMPVGCAEELLRRFQILYDNGAMPPSIYHRELHSLIAVLRTRCGGNMKRKRDDEQISSEKSGIFHMPEIQLSAKKTKSIGVPFSQSKRWARQRMFYETEGVNAWLDSHVPCRISSNSLCAAQIGKMALAFYNDWISQQQQSVNGSISLCEQNETLTVLELGAGHGLLSYHLALWFEEILEERGCSCGSLAHQPNRICVIMTDFNEALLQSHMKKTPFRRLIDAGILEFAVLDGGAEEHEATDDCSPQPIELLCSKSRLGPGPLFTIAHYFVDSLPCDAFLNCRLADESASPSYPASQSSTPFSLWELLEEVCVHSETGRVKERINFRPASLPRGVVESTKYREILNDTFQKQRDDKGATAAMPSAELRLIPFSLLGILQRLRNAAGANMPFGLIVGDAPAIFDDGYAQDLFRTLKLSREESSSTHNSPATSCSMRGALPEITPHADAIAVPCDFDVIETLFRLSRSSQKVSASESSRLFRGTNEVLRLQTPLFCSSFSILVLVDSAAVDGGPTSKFVNDSHVTDQILALTDTFFRTIAVTNTSTMEEVQSLVTGLDPEDPAVSLSQLLDLLEFSFAFDFGFFCACRWLIARKARVGTIVGDKLRLVRVVLECIKRNDMQIGMNIRQRASLRLDILRFFYVLGRGWCQSDCTDETSSCSRLAFEVVANLHGSSSNVKLLFDLADLVRVSSKRLPPLSECPPSIIAQEVALNTRLPGFREKARIALLELEHLPNHKIVIRERRRLHQHVQVQQKQRSSK